MNSDGTIFGQDDLFWSTYLRGRPKVPDTFFTRRLRTQFDHIIVSDIVPENIKLARARLLAEAPESRPPSPGYSFRVASLESAYDIPPGSVDLIFATNVMHFAEPQDTAMAVLARQLRPGGTFAAALFGPANFDDDEVQALWGEISQTGGRELLRGADQPEHTKRVMARTQGKYNVAPLSSRLFEAGAQRLHFNMGDHGERGIQGMLPPEETYSVKELDYTGPDDVERFAKDKDWDFETDLVGIKEHFASFPFVSKFPGAFVDLYAELDRLVGDKKVRGTFPVKIILATRHSD
ncbi:methyltransferase type 11 [Grosmannia clavigera kw1407]|uniref:Methyltransferase type 11 n=1 Tax=Grosmannia clavigera (strain kw1407 / UAMH 11150) TaxID=655863 RepID=F0XGI9_GROCL|nr:methyltransferase type 11 [Grosmannia clavigera kw1407]EFX03068.1 methyltransferase type 11 [Grosmannia clavigera kw1407]